MFEFKKDPITGCILSAAIQVHRALGKGFDADLYKIALCRELLSQGLEININVDTPVYYKGDLIGSHVVDLVVEEGYVLLIKASDTLAEDYQPEMRALLKASHMDIGLILNFGHTRMLDGIKRVYSPAQKIEITLQG